MTIKELKAWLEQFNDNDEVWPYADDTMMNGLAVSRGEDIDNYIGKIELPL